VSNPPLVIQSATLARLGRGVLRHHHRQAIRRGTFARRQEIVTPICTFIDGWNDRFHPFTWTKAADEILPHTRQRNSETRH
jgi:hypothetical protein